MPTPKPVAWLHGEIKSPPFSAKARSTAGALLRQLQLGESLSMPHSRPMPAIGSRCHELRLRDADRNWRVFYRIDSDVILIMGVEPKATRATPRPTIDEWRRRLRNYDDGTRSGGRE